MIDAYTIGIRLALSDEVSAGLKTVQRELVALDRSVAVSGAGLRALGQFGGDIGPQLRTAVNTHDARRGRTARPTAPVGPRGGAPATAPTAAAEPVRRPRADPASAGFPLTTALSLARRMAGTGFAGLRAVPSMSRAASGVMAAAGAPNRAMARLAPSQPTPTPRPVLAADRLLPIRRVTLAPERPQPTPRAGSDRRPPAPLPAAPRHIAAAGPRPLGALSPTTGPRRTAASGNAEPTWRGAPVMERDLAALADRLLAGRTSAPAAAASLGEPTRRPGSAPLQASASAGAPRRTEKASAPPLILPRRAETTRDVPAAQSRWNAPSPSGTPRTSLLRPLRAAAPTQPRAPRLGHPSAAAPLRRHSAPTPHRSEPDGASANRAAGGEIILDGVRFGRLLADRLARHLDRPRAGFTGTDPRATPTWPGVSTA